MSDNRRLYSRITRRETTSPRSTLAIGVATVVILLCVYAGVETMLSLIGQPPLLSAPADMGSALVSLPTYPAGIVIAAGIIAALIGVILIVVSLKRGRRARRVLDTGRTATVVDDEVIASALSRHAAFEGNVDPDDARVSVSSRRALVRLTPASGTSVPRSAVNDVVTRELGTYGLRPALRSRVVVDDRGKVGA